MFRNIYPLPKCRLVLGIIQDARFDVNTVGDDWLSGLVKNQPKWMVAALLSADPTNLLLFCGGHSAFSLDTFAGKPSTRTNIPVHRACRMADDQEGKYGSTSGILKA